MSIRYIKNWELNNFSDIIDVRSPSEFKEDHIPEANNFPVLSDLERKQIGIIYKQSSFKAKKLGAALISKNIGNHLKRNFLNKSGNWKPLIYCWRGGQRSKAFATVLSEIGWQVYVLKGGYKAYRSSIISKLKKACDNYKFVVLSGATGTAKTVILETMKKKGFNVLKLENIANHKGSLLGKLPDIEQPNQKYFETLLYSSVKNLKKNNFVFIEKESSKIGNLYLPSSILKLIRNSPLIHIDADIKSRINFLIKDYSRYLKKDDSFKDLFKHAVNKVGKRKVNEWNIFLKKKDWKNLAYCLLVDYYDPLYKHNHISKNLVRTYHAKNLEKKEISSLIKKITSDFCK